MRLELCVIRLAHIFFKYVIKCLLQVKGVGTPCTGDILTTLEELVRTVPIRI